MKTRKVKTTTGKLNLTGTVIFKAARKGGVVARFEGIIAFPDQRWEGFQPLEGDEWEVMTSGQNAAGNVLYLLPIGFISTKADRDFDKQAMELPPGLM